MSDKIRFSTPDGTLTTIIRINHPILARHYTKTSRSKHKQFRIVMAPNTVYQIVLMNDRLEDADAIVFIDGQELGIFRVYGKDTTVIKGPICVSRAFKFVGLTRDRISNMDGNITVVWYCQAPSSIKSAGWSLSGGYTRAVYVDSSKHSSFRLSFGQNIKPRPVEFCGTTRLGDSVIQTFNTVHNLLETLLYQSTSIKLETMYTCIEHRPTFGIIGDRKVHPSSPVLISGSPVSTSDSPASTSDSPLSSPVSFPSTAVSPPELNIPARRYPPGLPIHAGFFRNT